MDVLIERTGGMFKIWLDVMPGDRKEQRDRSGYRSGRAEHK